MGLKPLVLPNQPGSSSTDDTDSSTDSARAEVFFAVYVVKDVSFLYCEAPAPLVATPVFLLYPNVHNFVLDFYLAQLSNVPSLLLVFLLIFFFLACLTVPLTLQRHFCVYTSYVC